MPSNGRFIVTSDGQLKSDTYHIAPKKIHKDLTSVKTSAPKKKVPQGKPKPGPRSKRRIHIGSINAQGLRRKDKWQDLAKEFKTRNYFIAGVSETWMNGNGMQYDSNANVWMIYNGLAESETNPRGKWGIAFVLDHRAFQLWKKSGNRIEFQSARVGIIYLTVNDMDNRPLSMALTHAYAPQ